MKKSLDHAKDSLVERLRAVVASAAADMVRAGATHGEAWSAAWECVGQVSLEWNASGLALLSNVTMPMTARR